MGDARSLLQRIEKVPAASLKLYPDNPRQGNVEAIADSLRENSQYQPLVVQRGTDYVLSGNHTLLAARSLGWDAVDVVYVEVDHEAARKIVLSANRTADLATYNEQVLLELLQSVPDLSGTGYSPDDVDDLLAQMGDMPVLPAYSPGNGYAETDEETRERMDHFADAQPRSAFGVREAILILPQEQYDELQGLIAAVKRCCPEGTTPGEAVLRGMKAAAAAITSCDGGDKCAWCVSG